MNPIALLLAIIGLLIIGFPIGKALLIAGILGCIVCTFFMLTVKDARLESFLLFGIPSIICLIIGWNNQSLLLYEIFF